MVASLYVQNLFSKSTLGILNIITCEEDAQKFPKKSKNEKTTMFIIQESQQ